MRELGKELPIWLLAVLSWLLAAYFLFAFARQAGFPPTVDVGGAALLYLGCGLLFLFLPFFHRLKIANVIELDRTVRRTRSELQDFRAEVRSSLAVMSASVSTAASMQQTQYFGVPSSSDLHEAKHTIGQVSLPGTQDEAQRIREELMPDGEDLIMALARTRIRLEYLLRRVLDKCTELRWPDDRDAKYMGLTRMFERAAAVHPVLAELQEPFDYVRRMSNAAVHAQRVTDEQARQALDMGAMLIAVIGHLAAGGADGPEA